MLNSTNQVGNIILNIINDNVPIDTMSFDELVEAETVAFNNVIDLGKEITQIDIYSCNRLVEQFKIENNKKIRIFFTIDKHNNIVELERNEI